MSSAKGPCATSSVRKLKPRVKWPRAAALSGLSLSDIKMLKRRLSEPAECVFDPWFQRADAEGILLGPLPDSPRHGAGASADSDDSGADLLPAPARRSLTPEQERHLFLRLN